MKDERPLRVGIVVASTLAAVSAGVAVLYVVSAAGLGISTTKWEDAALWAVLGLAIIHLLAGCASVLRPAPAARVTVVTSSVLAAVFFLGLARAMLRTGTESIYWLAVLITLVAPLVLSGASLLLAQRLRGKAARQLRGAA